MASLSLRGRLYRQVLLLQRIREDIIHFRWSRFLYMADNSLRNIRRDDNNLSLHRKNIEH